MKCRFAGMIVATAVVGSASAELLTITDGGSGTPYGDVSGFVVDFDTTYNTANTFSSGWNANLLAGQQYRIDSISLWEASDAKNPADSTPVYLSAFNSTFAGFNGDTSGSYLTHSDNAISHTATPDTTKITYTFTDLFVTVDSDGTLSGSGLLYFTWDNDTTRNNFGAQGVHPLQRIDSNPTATSYGAAIYAFGAIQGSRVPEIEIMLTAVPVPEPTTLSILGLTGVALVLARRRSGK